MVASVVQLLTLIMNFLQAVAVMQVYISLYYIIYIYMTLYITYCLLCDDNGSISSTPAIIMLSYVYRMRYGVWRMNNVESSLMMSYLRHRLLLICYYISDRQDNTSFSVITVYNVALPPSLPLSLSISLSTG